MNEAGQIKAIREAALRALADLHDRIAPLLQEIERKKKEIALLDDLMRLHTGEEASVRLEPSVQSARANRTNTAMVENAKKILAEAARPLHISELKRIFLERGIPIPGQGNEANLISHLRRSPDIVRVKRGFYALSDSADVQASVPAQAERKRRRRRGRKIRRLNRPLAAETGKVGQSGSPAGEK